MNTSIAYSQYIPQTLAVPSVSVTVLSYAGKVFSLFPSRQSLNRVQSAYTPPNNSFIVSGWNMEATSEISILNKNISLLQSYKSLQRDWNGNDGEPFDGGFIDSVIALLEGLDKQPKVFPTAQNSIQLEYYRKGEDTDYLELEVFPKKVEVYIERFGSPAEEFSIPATQNEMNKVISDFYGC